MKDILDPGTKGGKHVFDLRFSMNIYLLDLLQKLTLNVKNKINTLEAVRERRNSLTN